MEFEQYWRENEAQLAADFYKSEENKWDVYGLAREIYNRKETND